MDESNIHFELTKEELEHLYEITENNYANVTVKDELRRSIQHQIYHKAYKYLDREVVTEITKNKYCKENQFDEKPLFLGAGFHSVNRSNMLHKRLAYAVLRLNYAQQNGLMGYKFDEAADQEANAEIKKALRDIISAFGFKVSDLND